MGSRVPKMTTDILVRGRPTVTYGEIVYPAGSTYGPLVQPTIELGLVHTGTMTFWIDGARHEAPAGSACLLLPGHHHRFAFSSSSETHHSWVHLWSTEGYPGPMIERMARLPRIIRLSSTLTREMHELLELSASRLPSRSEIEVFLTLRMLYQYVGEAELADGRGASYDGPVERALQHIDAHLGSPLDLETLAEIAAVSPSHLIRLFRRQLSTTPSRYLWSRRVQRGVELLEETGLSIGEIARRTGFQTSHHFSRRVREATGMAPTDLRARASARGSTEASLGAHG
jgi:AraC-like DNA-binding protein